MSKTPILLALLVVMSWACVNRQDAVNRAMEWVHDHVPYDASKYHGGYIQGCEGIVGYAWLFPKPGVYSGDLIPSGYCTKTTKANMAMGDIMVCPGHHQLLIDSWVDPNKSEYWAIELGGSPGSVKYKIPWPYHANLNPSCYIPCKVVKACTTEEEPNLSLE